MLTNRIISLNLVRGVHLIQWKITTFRALGRDKLWA